MLHDRRQSRTSYESKYAMQMKKEHFQCDTYNVKYIYLTWKKSEHLRIFLKETLRIVATLFVSFVNGVTKTQFP